MSSYKVHCAECEEKLGKQWNIVHKWIDRHCMTYATLDEQGRPLAFSIIHWLHLHHKEGVELARKKWGDDAAKAAELHILADYAGFNLGDKVLSQVELYHEYARRRYPIDNIESYEVD